MNIIKKAIDIDSLLLPLAYTIVFLVSLTFHEIAHGYTALKLGDATAKRQGRLSLNPFKHIDMFGLILLIAARVGYAKPVMINPHNLENPKRDMAVISLAGPITNLFLAAVFSIPFYMLKHNYFLGIPVFLGLLIEVGYFLNITFAVFNILPIPPLDGSKVIGCLLPDTVYNKIVMFNPMKGMGLIIILSVTGILAIIMNPMMNSVHNFYTIIAKFFIDWFG